MMYPLVLDLADDGVPVTVTCRVLGFSTQAFYKWRKAPVSQRDWGDAHLINAARDIHADDPAFGYRFIADELPGRGILLLREPCRTVVFPRAHLVDLRQEARTEPSIGATGAR